MFPALRQPGAQATNVHLELVTVRVEEIEGIAFTSIYLPLADSFRLKVLSEPIEIRLWKGEGVVGIADAGRADTALIERQAQPKLSQRKIGAGIPRGGQSKTEQTPVKIHTARQVPDGEGYMVKSG